MRIVFVLAVLGSLFLYGTKQSKLSIKGFSINAIFVFFKNLHRKIYLQVISFSVIRYLIFSFQYFVLLLFFGVDISYIDAMVVITSMYLLSSIVPALAVFDVIIKTSVSVFLFGYLGIDELTILSISTLMWLLNFIFPSLFGSYYVLNFNLPKPNSE